MACLHTEVAFLLSYSISLSDLNERVEKRCRKRSWPADYGICAVRLTNFRAPQPIRHGPVGSPQDAFQRRQSA
jgi:hypothetical protein